MSWHQHSHRAQQFISFTEDIKQSRITIKLFQWIKSHWTSKWCS